MPAKTEKQRRFFGAELARKRAGKKTRTDLSEKELSKMASKKYKSPPSGVQGFTQTTDLPHRTDHGTSPVPAEPGGMDASVSGGPPAPVQKNDPFSKYGKASTPMMKESESKGPDLSPSLPADVQKNFKRIP